MINKFACKETERIWNGFNSNKFPQSIQNSARRKLRYIDSADNINDLKIPPGNRFEKLKGKRKDQYSIRINNQWRICFKWDDDATDVEIVDYH